jgi:aminoglycoside phosphotransferase (APT) family kinase protein
VATVRNAWRAAAPESAEAMAERTAVLLQRLVGNELPRCAVHGDFWRGNLAAADGRLRVFDWEWAQPEGMPLFDLWTYELAELRLRAARGERHLEPGLHAALAAVKEELEVRGIDPSWALATLAPVLAEFSFRIRRRLGTASSMEGPSMVVMAAAERLFDA